MGGGCEVVVEKNNRTCVFGRVTACVHSYAHVGAFEGGSVVDAVAGHTYAMTYNNNNNHSNNNNNNNTITATTASKQRQ